MGSYFRKKIFSVVRRIIATHYVVAFFLLSGENTVCWPGWNLLSSEKLSLTNGFPTFFEAGTPFIKIK